MECCTGRLRAGALRPEPLVCGEVTGVGTTGEAGVWEGRWGIATLGNADSAPGAVMQRSTWCTLASSSQHKPGNPLFTNTTTAYQLPKPPSYDRHSCTVMRGRWTRKTYFTFKASPMHLWAVNCFQEGAAYGNTARG